MRITKYTYNTQAIVPIFFIIVIFVGSLFTLQTLGEQSLSAYYNFLLPVCIMFLTCVLLYLVYNNHEPVKISVPIPIILMACWMLYDISCSFIHPLFVSSWLWLYTGFFVYFISCWLFLKVSGSKVVTLYLFKSLAVIFVLEALICLIQQTGIVNSYSRYFQVTGTWENPNVTAMTLTMAMPMALYLYKSANSIKETILSVFYIIVLFLAVFILRSRTAIIGLAVVVGFHIVPFINSKIGRQKNIVKIIGGCLIIVIGIILTLLFYQKNASTMGRIHIVLNTLKMIGNRPFSGYGIGMFEKEYSLLQSGNSEYFQTGHVFMPYNEFLLQSFEGGVLQSILWIFFMISLFIVQKKKSITPESKSSIGTYQLRSAIAAYLLMSLFNFGLASFPTTLMFLLYAAIGCHMGLYKCLKLENVSVYLSGKNKIILAVFTGIFSSVMFLHFKKERDGFYATENARQLLNNDDANTSISILKPQEFILEKSDRYNEIMANAYFYSTGISPQQRYDSGMHFLNRALQYSSRPTLYRQKAFLLFQHQQYSESENLFILLCALSPKRLEPLQDLMIFYEKTGQRVQCYRYAKSILQRMAVSTNGRDIRIKEQAEKILREH